MWSHRRHPTLLLLVAAGLEGSISAAEDALPELVISDDPFPRPKGLFSCPKGSLGCHVHRANASEAKSWVRPQYCCCQAPRRCWNGKACVVCPGSLTTWRSAVGLQADLLLIGILSCPRLTSAWLHLEGPVEMPSPPHTGILSRWWLEQLASADAPTADAWDGLVSPQLGGVLSWLLFPQWHLMAPLLPTAADSFWWVLPLVHASLMHWLTDLALVTSLLFFHHRFGVELQCYIMSAGMAFLTVATIYVAYALVPSCGAAFADAFIRLLCMWHALDACSKPLRALWVMRDHFLAANIFATIHLLLLMTLISVSNRGHISYDAVTLMLLVGPGSLAFLRFRDGFLSEHPQACIIVDRGRLLESSVEALSRLGPRALQSGLPHVTYVNTGAGQSLEEGVDAGGLGRDWLNRVTAEAFDPARGLVDVALVDGTPYARLRPGADLAQLEAAGKVLGLALRVGQPLGVDVCAPLAHQLAHPNLPQALDAITSSLCGASAEGAEEPIMADFSGDGPPPILGVSGWERLRHRRDRRRYFRAIAELLSIGFSRDWLRWVSSDEYAYWHQCLSGGQPVGERAQSVRALGVETADGRVVTLRNVREHMARRALDALVLDVRKETEALWRGLHSIPGVPLPQLRSEVRGSKRLRSRVEEDDGEDPSSRSPQAQKRRRLAADEPSSDAAHASSTPAEASRKRRHDGEQAVSESRAGAGEGSQEPAAKRPRNLLSAEDLEPSPLQMMLSGNRDVPVEDWKRLTTCDFGTETILDLTEGSRAVRLPSGRAIQTLAWFWEHVEGLPAKERADLLEWITGYRRLPAGGFPPPVRHMTIALINSDQHLPVAHTCSLQLDLPVGYDSAETLRAKLTEASTQQSFFIA